MLGVNERHQLSHLGEEGAVDWEPLREKAELGCKPSLHLSCPGPAAKAAAGIAPSQPYFPVLCTSLNYQYLKDLHFVGLRLSINNRDFFRVQHVPVTSEVANASPLTHILCTKASRIELGWLQFPCPPCDQDAVVCTPNMRPAFGDSSREEHTP